MAESSEQIPNFLHPLGFFEWRRYLTTWVLHSESADDLGRASLQNAGCSVGGLELVWRGLESEISIVIRRI